MSAIFSPCRTYRYRLERDLGGAGLTAAVLMVNPSTADATNDDNTITRVRGFAQREGWSRLLVGNKFALRATDITELRTATDPCGPENNNHLEQILRDADVHLVAWGTLRKLPPQLQERWRTVAEIADRVGCRLLCLGTTGDGHPRHPLMLASDTPLAEWNRPR